MSSATSDLTAATRKWYKPATDWTLFKKEVFAFWHGVDRSREDRKTQAAAPQHSEQAQETLRTPESTAQRYTPFSTDLVENRTQQSP